MQNSAASSRGVTMLCKQRSSASCIRTRGSGLANQRRTRHSLRQATGSRNHHNIQSHDSGRCAKSDRETGRVHSSVTICSHHGFSDGGHIKSHIKRVVALYTWPSVPPAASSKRTD